MMLWYKAWRESRLGFVLSVFGLVLVCLLYLRYAGTRPHGKYTDLQAIYLVTYHGAILNVFIFLSLLLGLGGLLRERAHGTLGFTLTLPVSRLRLIVARAGVGLIEMAALALTVAVLASVWSSWSHHSYPSIAQSLHFAVLWVACGTIFFAAGLLLSTVVPGDYPAATACLISLFAYGMATDLNFAQRFRSFDLFDVMGAFHMPYFSGRDTCFVTYLPWMTILPIVLVAVGILVVA